MEIVDIKNVIRKDSPIHYINEYHSVLEYKLDNRIIMSDIEIIIEKTAFGTSNIHINFLDQDMEILKKHVDRLTAFIADKQKEGYFSE
jgi:hypothetical protein